MKLHPLLLLLHFGFSSSILRINAMGSWWEKPCIFYGVRDTRGWESEGKKYLYFGESMGTNFQGSLNSMDFAVFFHCYGKLIGKPKHFSCIEEYYRKGIWLEKRTHTIWKVWVPISQAFRWILLHFPVLSKVNGETRAFFIWWSIPQDGNLMEKSTHTMEKV